MKMPVIVLAATTVSFLTVSASFGQSSSMGGMDMKPPSSMQSDANTHKAAGTVTAKDAATRKVTIAHGAIPSMNWPPMTMTFSVRDKSMLDRVAPGEKVDFEFQKQGSAYLITTIK